MGSEGTPYTSKPKGAITRLIERVAADVLAANHAGPRPDFDEVPGWRRAAVMSLVGGILIESNDDPTAYDPARLRRDYLAMLPGLERGVIESVAQADREGKPVHDREVPPGPVDLDRTEPDERDAQALAIILAALPEYAVLRAEQVAARGNR